MRNLTSEEINSILAKKKFAKAKRIAVENFLMTVGNNKSYGDAFNNLIDDARAYRWNAHTFNAISKGIEIAFKQ